MRKITFELYPETQVFEFPTHYSDEKIDWLFYQWKEKKTSNALWHEATDEDIKAFGISNIDEEV